jgi:NMD protein affecting ribosome stability and mRNA decay
MSFKATFKDEYDRDIERFWNAISNGNCFDCNIKLEQVQNGATYRCDTNTAKNVEYLVVAKCPRCGKTYSFFTYAQWVKNKVDGARQTLYDSKEDLTDAKEKMEQEIAKTEKEFADKKTEINQKIADAKTQLKKFTPENRLLNCKSHAKQ